MNQHMRNLPPTFWTEGYSTPTFQDEKVKNLLSSAVNRGDLRRINYNKTRTSLGELMTFSQTPESDGCFLPILLPFRLRTQGRLVLLLNWYPHFLDQSYTPVNQCLITRLDADLTSRNRELVNTTSRLAESRFVVRMLYKDIH